MCRARSADDAQVNARAHEDTLGADRVACGRTPLLAQRAPACEGKPWLAALIVRNDCRLNVRSAVGVVTAMEELTFRELGR